MKRFHTQIAFLLITAVISLGLSQAVLAKGPRNKVTVESATPAEATQGTEETVLVNGSGFDQGSNVQYLVTGTTDGSQVEVISVEYVSSTQLKTKIRPKDAAVVTDYDIEVRTSSGRKGKGTTLFKVKSINPANPALVVASGNSQFTSLYLVDVDGSNFNKIVHSASTVGFNSMPTVWSADGAGIVWYSRKRSTFEYVNADGTGQRQLAKSDRTRHLSAGGQRNLGASSLDCSGQPANLIYFIAEIFDDEWRHQDFYVLDIDDHSSSPVRLTNNLYEGHTTLAVSPLGESVATWTSDEWSDLPNEPSSRLEIRDLCSSGLPVVETWTKSDLGLPIDSYIEALAWSESNLLAASVVSSESNWQFQIYLIDLDPLEGPVTAAKIIGDGTGIGEGVDNLRLAWSPDGSKLAFSSDNLGYVLEVATGQIWPVSDPYPIRDIDWRPTWVEKP